MKTSLKFLGTDYNGELVSKELYIYYYIEFPRISFRSTLKSMRSLLKLGKQRPPRARSCDNNSETRELLDRQDSSCPTSNEPSRTNSMTSLETNTSDNDSQVSANPEQEETAVKSAKKSKPKVNIFYIFDKIYVTCCMRREEC